MSGFTIDVGKSFSDNLVRAGVEGGEATIIGELNQMTLRSGKTYSTIPGAQRGGNYYTDLAKAAIIGAYARAKDPAITLARAAGKVAIAGSVLYATHLGFEQSLCAPFTSAAASYLSAVPIIASQHAQCSAAAANYNAAIGIAGAIITPGVLSAVRNVASIFVSDETINAVATGIRDAFMAAPQQRRGGKRKAKKTRKAKKSRKTMKSRKHTRRH